jgi:hypothetical protein
LVHQFACRRPLRLGGLGQLLELSGEYLLAFRIIGELLLNLGPPLHARFMLPDPLPDLPKTRRARYAGLDIIAVPQVGSFARVLLPITMIGEYRLTLGTWLSSIATTYCWTGRSTPLRALRHAGQAAVACR